MVRPGADGCRWCDGGARGSDAGVGQRAAVALGGRSGLAKRGWCANEDRGRWGRTSLDGGGWWRGRLPAGRGSGGRRYGRGCTRRSDATHDVDDRGRGGAVCAPSSRRVAVAGDSRSSARSGFATARRRRDASRRGCVTGRGAGKGRRSGPGRSRVGARRAAVGGRRGADDLHARRGCRGRDGRRNERQPGRAHELGRRRHCGPPSLDRRHLRGRRPPARQRRGWRRCHHWQRAASQTEQHHKRKQKKRHRLPSIGISPPTMPACASPSPVGSSRRT